ncbi:uncharacterized protein LOC113380628 [Ctenocephalides felis]|uniref:uncharacterized protein LOC113380628 n=1 Tax=Ctenocephalides felis TaxID=7515 RepID=UPI000E6E321C|nr:uncharacterized protein LOC113380628 [Ctenocephalides felis]
MDVTILQWNARSFMSNRSSLEYFLSCQDISILAITETWFQKEKTYVFSNYNIVREDRDDGKGGAAIFVHRNQPYNVVAINLGSLDPKRCQSCGIYLMVENVKLYVISIYVAPNYYISVNEWNDFLSRLPKPVILCGDFNAHHFSWDSNFSDKYGNNFLEAIENNNLYILNNGKPTLKFKNNMSVVDISLCSHNFAHRIDWNVCDDSLGSDHYPILLKLRGVPRTRKYNPSWNCKKADWTKYQSEIGKNLESFNSNDPVRAYDFFINAINSAARKSIPIKNGDLNAKCAKPVWWDEECDKLIRERRKAEKIYRQKSSYENFVVCNTINSNIVESCG